MATILATVFSIAALTLSVAAVGLSIANGLSVKKTTPAIVRVWEVKIHARKLCRWIYHYLACSIPIGSFFTCLWVLYLREAMATGTFVQAMAEAPRVVLFLALASIVYTSGFLLNVYWHLYSISRAYREPGEIRLRDKIIAHFRQNTFEDQVVVIPLVDPDAKRSDPSNNHTNDRAA